MKFGEHGAIVKHTQVLRLNFGVLILAFQFLTEQLHRNGSTKTVEWTESTTTNLNKVYGREPRSGAKSAQGVVDRRDELLVQQIQTGQTGLAQEQTAHWS